MSHTSLRAMTDGPLRSKLAWLPAFPEIFLAILMLALSGRASAWQSLLGDADAGWHIRTGEFILGRVQYPSATCFRFRTRNALVCLGVAGRFCAGSPLGELGSRRGPVYGAAVRVGRRRTGLAPRSRRWPVDCPLSDAGGRQRFFDSLSGAAARLLDSAFSASPLALILESDRQQPPPRVWLLVLLSALWANLRGAFVAWLVTVAFLPLAVAVERDRRKFRRYACVAGLCAGSTLLNPYGWRLHAHVVSYLGSS